jgi:tetrahydromethanopterin S-methyltransferase subunit D
LDLECAPGARISRTPPVSSRSSIGTLVKTAAGQGDITGLIHAAGVSPSQAPVEAILAVDLYGTAVLLEEVGNVIAAGGAGVVIASQRRSREHIRQPISSAMDA